MEEFRTVKQLRDYLDVLLNENEDLDLIQWNDSGEENDFGEDILFPTLLKGGNLKVLSNNDIENECVTGSITRRYIRYPKSLNIFPVPSHLEDEESLEDDF
jgi:hypothetical protein